MKIKNKLHTKSTIFLQTRIVYSITYLAGETSHLRTNVIQQFTFSNLIEKSKSKIKSIQKLQNNK